MSRYEERLAHDKSELRRRIVRMGAQVVDAVEASIKALLAGDHARSYQIIIDDLPVNRESRSIDKACHAFVARHLPSAGHLRFVSSVMRMNLELERVGDYAVSIARQAVQLSAPPKGSVADDMTTMADQSNAMLRDALEAFGNKDAELARETKPTAKSLERDNGKIFNALTSDSTRSTADSAGLVVVFDRLERVSGQAKNICEETLFEVLGETKPPKRYRILFVDARHSLVAPLAELLARKAFPESGQFESAGFQPADALSDELVSIAPELGIDVADLSPRKLDPERLSKYHAVVWLVGDPARHVERMPFHTVLLRWELPKVGDADSDVRQGVREIANALSAEIRELMVTMSGEDAS